MYNDKVKFNNFFLNDSENNPCYKTVCILFECVFLTTKVWIFKFCHIFYGQNIPKLKNL